MSLHRSLIIVLALAAALIATSPASAHNGIQSYVYLSVFDDGVEGRVEYPIGDLADALGIELPADRAAAFATMQTHTAEVIDYTDSHLQMGDPDDPWVLRFANRLDPLDAGVTDYVLVPFFVDRSFSETPRSWPVTYDGIIEGNPERDALLLIEDDWRTGTFDNEAEHLLGFSVGNETQVVELDDVSTIRSMWEVARLGSVAVDRSQVQVLSVLTLALAATTVALARREDPTTIRAQAIHVGQWVASFLVAQFIAVWLVGLSGIGLTERLSIATAALGAAAVAAALRLVGRSAQLACALGGILTGLGLGSAFLALQLDQSRPATSVLSFSLGVFVTVAVLALLYTPLAVLAARFRHARLAVYVIAAFAAAVGIAGLVDRIADLDLPLRRFGFMFADFATSPIVIAVVTGLLAVATIRESNASGDPGGNEAIENERIEIP